MGGSASGNPGRGSPPTASGRVDPTTSADSASLPASAAVIEASHDELSAALSSLTPKAATVRLLLYARGLPSLEAAPQTVFYHVDALSRLVDLILGPVPVTGKVELLGELRDLLNPAGSDSIAARVPGLRAAWRRICALEALELAIRGRCGECAAAVASLGYPAPLTWGVDDLLAAFQGSCWEADFQIPWHLRHAAALSAGSVRTVLVDGPDVASAYREAYLATVSARVTVRGSRRPGPPAVRALNTLGEDLPLGEELKDLVREAHERAVAFLGPSARARWASAQLTVELDIRCPFTVTAVTGRSILLPLTLVIARHLGEQLNLSAMIDPDPGVVWTGDVDNHGAVGSVQDLDLKVERVLASTARGFAFPAPDGDIVTGAIGAARATPLALIPLTHLQDAGASDAVAIRGRSLSTRAVSVVRRRARPLGIAGVIAAGLLLTGVGLVIANLATLLDTAPASVRFTKDHRHIEVLNSRQRTVRSIPITPTHAAYPILADMDGTGEPEILFGTSVDDPVPGTLLCLDARGGERWRFQGGFTSGEFWPEGFANRFSCGGAYVHDMDHDGAAEVIAVFHHTPFYPTQVALLDSQGACRSSFWNAGHLTAGSFWSVDNQVLFADIDTDGYDEFLVTGTNNALGSAVLVALDPRSIHGSSPGRTSPGSFSWQSYVVFPRSDELQNAMGSDRIIGREVQWQSWAGAPRLKVALSAHVSGRGAIGAFAVFLRPDFSFVDMYPSDEFSQWMGAAYAEGRMSFDYHSPGFQSLMRQIRIIPGPPELLKP